MLKPSTFQKIRGRAHPINAFCEITYNWISEMDPNCTLGEIKEVDSYTTIVNTTIVNTEGWF